MNKLRGNDIIEHVCSKNSSLLDSIPGLSVSNIYLKYKETMKDEEVRLGSALAVNKIIEETKPRYTVTSDHGS